MKAKGENLILMMGHHLQLELYSSPCCTAESQGASRSKKAKIQVAKEPIAVEKVMPSVDSKLCAPLKMFHLRSQLQQKKRSLRVQKLFLFVIPDTKAVCYHVKFFIVN